MNKIQQRYETVRDLINELNAINIAEIGVFEGETTKFILKNCSQIKTFLLVDPYDSKPYSKYYSPLYDELKGRNVSFFKMTSEQAAPIIKDGSLDLVFIDGLHDFDNVTLDINLWLPKVRSGGILCGHDYGQKSIYPPVGKTAIIEVTEAVDKIFGADNIDFVLDVVGVNSKRKEDQKRSVWIYHVK